MSRFVIASVVTGVVFAVLDGLIHANPLAQRLYAVYKPLARTSVNAPAGIAIDLAYGFLMAAVFLLLSSPRRSKSTARVSPGLRARKQRSRRSFWTRSPTGGARRRFIFSTRICRSLKSTAP